jgi:hypothetical protein
VIVTGRLYFSLGVRSISRILPRYGEPVETWSTDILDATSAEK